MCSLPLHRMQRHLLLIPFHMRKFNKRMRETCILSFLIYFFSVIFVVPFFKCRRRTYLNVVSLMGSSLDAGWGSTRVDRLNQSIVALGRAPSTEHVRETISPATTGATGPRTFRLKGLTEVPSNIHFQFVSGELHFQQETKQHKKQQE